MFQRKQNNQFFFWGGEEEVSKAKEFRRFEAFKRSGIQRGIGPLAPMAKTTAFDELTNLFFLESIRIYDYIHYCIEVSLLEDIFFFFLNPPHFVRKRGCNIGKAPAGEAKLLAKAVRKRLGLGQ